jgi:hypothetical protein
MMRRCIRGNQLIREHNPTRHDLERIEAVEQHLMTAMEEDRAMEAGVGIGDRNWIAHNGGLAEPVEGALDLLLVHPRGAARLERKARRVRFKKARRLVISHVWRDESWETKAPRRGNTSTRPMSASTLRASRTVPREVLRAVAKAISESLAPGAKLPRNDRIADVLADRLHHRVGPLEGNQGWFLRYC